MPIGNKLAERKRRQQHSAVDPRQNEGAKRQRSARSEAPEGAEAKGVSWCVAQICEAQRSPKEDCLYG